MFWSTPAGAETPCLTSRGDYVQTLELGLDISALRDTVEGFKECLSPLSPDEGAKDRLILARASLRLATKSPQLHTFQESWQHIEALAALEKYDPRFGYEKLYLEGQWFTAVPSQLLPEIDEAYKQIKVGERGSTEIRQHALTLIRKAEENLNVPSPRYDITFFRLKEEFSLSPKDAQAGKLDEMKALRKKLVAEEKKTVYAISAAIDLLLFLQPRLNEQELQVLCGHERYSACTKRALKELQEYEALLRQLPGLVRDLRERAERVYAYDSTLGLIVSEHDTNETEAFRLGQSQLLFMKDKVEALRRELEATQDAQVVEHLSREITRWSTWTANSILYPPLKDETLRHQWSKTIPEYVLWGWLESSTTSSENDELKRIALLSELYIRGGENEKAKKLIQQYVDQYQPPESKQYQERVAKPGERIDEINVILLQTARLNLLRQQGPSGTTKEIQGSIHYYYKQKAQGGQKSLPAWLQMLYTALTLQNG